MPEFRTYTLLDREHVFALHRDSPSIPSQAAMTANDPLRA
jgi:hypothetical protein